MKTSKQVFLAMFEEISSAEDCPGGIELLVWDGCEFHIDWVDTCADTGVDFFSNGTEGIAYIELPDSVLSEAILGSNE